MGSLPETAIKAWLAHHKIHREKRDPQKPSSFRGKSNDLIVDMASLLTVPMVLIYLQTGSLQSII
jgi:hypothetical protein